MLSRFNYTARRYVGQILLDAAVVFLSCYLSRFLLLGGKDGGFYAGVFQSCLIATPIYCSVNYLFALYQRIWRYASAQEVVAIFEAAVVGTLVLALVDVVVLAHPLSPKVLFLGGFFAFASFTAVRYRWRLVTGSLLRWGTLRGHWPVPPTRVLIVGAGEAGQLLAWQLRNHGGMRNHGSKKGCSVIGFIDDDPRKQGMWLHGVRILGNRHQIPDIVSRKDLDLIILAVPNIPDSDFEEIISICLETSACVKLLPDTFELIESNNGGLPIKHITVQDLVDREPVAIDFGRCRQILAGKIVLVTGAAGSIGSELCRQILNFEPRCLLALDNNETGLYELNLELNQDGNLPLRVVLADVTNAWKMEEVFQEQRPDIVFHAAAYKHVPLMEEYPSEAVRVNVMGTVILSQLADEHGVERFTYISTDKAVNPTSVMGASKRIGETWIAALQRESRTRYAIVRFGNVIGSRGSVVPTFQKQIKRGGPVTVTHPDMTRFFMSIPEAVRLTIQAASFTNGRGIYMLDMGKQVRILDLAHKMIRLRGLRVDKDVKIELIGMRPGEKMHEELIYADEERQPTPHPKVFRLVGDNHLDKRILLPQIMVLVAASQSNHEMITRLRRAIIKASLEDIDGMLDTLADTKLLSDYRNVGGMRPAALSSRV